MVPWNWLRSHGPIPETMWGGGPSWPSVYCQRVYFVQPTGRTGFGPYCESQSGHLVRISSTRPPRLSFSQKPPYNTCLLYTSDAADERSSVDLGGRRIIK